MLRMEYSVWREYAQRGGAARIGVMLRGVASGEEVEVFRFPVRPHMLSVVGEQFRGIISVEEGDVFSYRLLRWGGERRRVKARINVKGRYTGGVFDGEVYRARVSWRGRHQHVLEFHGGYTPRVVRPRGYVVSRSKGRLVISWLWEDGYSGEIYVKLASASRRA